MTRLHCPTCTCGAEPIGRDRSFRVNTRAPFYALVIEIDRLTLADQRERWRQALETTS